QVERDAALVGVEIEEEPALLRMRDAAGERTATAGPIALAGPLDLHHVGAEIGEELRRVGRRHEVADLEHAESLERTGHPTARRTSSWTLVGSSTRARRVMSAVCECSSTGQS